MTDASTISTLNVRPRPIARIVAIGGAALLSTLATTLTLFVFAFVWFFPDSRIVFEESDALFLSLYPAVFLAPITLVLLPLAAIFLRRDVPALIILSVVGSIGGAGSVWLFFGSPVSPILVVLGAIVGLVAGGYFCLALARLGK